MDIKTDEEIVRNAENILKSLPADVLLVAASKTRTADEVESIIRAGVKILGYNYVQEAVGIKQKIDYPVQWHMIGHLQRNKVKIAAGLFDMIETIDSDELAVSVNRHCNDIGKIMPVLIEINSGKESNKTGVMPENVKSLILKIKHLPCIRIQGLMTMGPRFGNPEDARPYFRTARSLFEEIKSSGIDGVEMKYLSMGMSNSYKVAVSEGANVVRIGTLLFGERSYPA